MPKKKTKPAGSRPPLLIDVEHEKRKAKEFEAEVAFRQKLCQWLNRQQHDPRFTDAELRKRALLRDSPSPTRNPAAEVAFMANAAVAAVMELETDLAEETTLREDMASILTRTANALNGVPVDGVRWSWHDLPDLAKELVGELDKVYELWPGARHLVRRNAELQSVTATADKPAKGKRRRSR